MSSFLRANTILADLFHDVEYKTYLILFALALGTLCFLTYLITCLVSSSTWRSHWKNKRPPLAPYYVPILRHALAFFWDTGVVGEVQRSVSVSGK